MTDVDDFCRRLYQSAMMAEGRCMPRTAEALLDLAECLADEAGLSKSGTSEVRQILGLAPEDGMEVLREQSAVLPLRTTAV